MRRREYAPQQTIVREGGAGDAAFLIISGLVAVRHKHVDSGVEFFLAELGPGQMFGEMALITGKPRNASVMAIEQTSCAVLERADFERALMEHPGIALALSRVMAERLERANRSIGIDFVNLSRLKIDPRVLTLLPTALVNAHRCVPIAFVNNRLTLAMTDPNNIIAFDDVRRVLKGVMIEPAAVSEDDFKRFIATTYAEALAKERVCRTGGVAAPRRERPAAKTDVAATVDLLQSDMIRELQLTEDDAAAVETKQDLMSASQDAPIIRLANSVLGLAIKQGASDIHIEPMEGDVTLRYRIDGVLQVVQRLPKRVQMGLVSRIKILSKLDIAEKRLPQDGRFAVTLDGKPIDFRVSTVPGKWGEKVVLRILDKTNTQLGLDKLITDAGTLALVREMIAQPYGIIYVTGPTGSGKTTTLYSALAEINDPGGQHLHGGGSDRVRPARRHPDPGQPGDRPDVRQYPARVPAPGSRRDARRRDARQGDGAHGRRGGAHGASRLHHAAHQQRRGRLHAARRNGDRAVSRVLLDDRRHRAAPRAPLVPELPRAVRAGRGDAQVLRPRRRGDALPRARLLEVRRQRREGARRDLRGDAHDAAVASARREGIVGRRDSRRRPRRRHGRSQGIRGADARPGLHLR